MVWLIIEVVEALDLLNKKDGEPCDPYVRVQVNNVKKTTCVCWQNVSPKWNEIFYFEVEDPESIDVTISCYDYERFNSTFLGAVVFSKKNEKFFNDCGSDRKWLNLKGKKKSGVSGKILIGIDISQNRPSKVDVKVKKKEKKKI